ncbi:MAG TPA: hypothetical protein VIE43_03545 [Thermoanaerobaculia bacterium]|jgi:hypothetical protein|nr:hypothetical protein [Thermoanaerobaculia bacterium]
METQKVVPNPTGVTSAAAKADGTLRLATIEVDLKPERVQDSLGAAGGATPATPSVSLRLAIHQPQTVTLGTSGSALTIAFTAGNGINTGNGTAAPAA